MTKFNSFKDKIWNKFYKFWNFTQVLGLYNIFDKWNKIILLPFN